MPLERRATASEKRPTTSGAGARRRCSQTSPGFIVPPATAAHSVRASRRESLTPARSSGSTAASSAAAMERGERAATGSGTEPLPLSREPQRVDHIVQIAVQHLGEIVNGVVDAMIRDPVLGEVVRANLRGAVTGADLGAPLASPGGFLLGDHLVEQARAQHVQRLDLVLELALLVLALHDEAAREMRDPDGAVGGVDALAARPLRAEHVDPQVLVVDLHVDLFGLGEDRDGKIGRASCSEW